MYLEECKYIVKEKKTNEYIKDDLEVSIDDSNNEENSNEEIFHEEDSNDEEEDFFGEVDNANSLTQK